MRSTAKYMWDVVEKSLSNVIQTPPVMHEGDANSPQKTSERVALMYVSQLRHSAIVAARRTCSW